MNWRLWLARWILWAVDYFHVDRDPAGLRQIALPLVANPGDKRRSSKWPAVRRAWLLEHPTCDLCGGDRNLEVHHVEPFHQRPDLELQPSNLLTLCEDSGRVKGLNCHLVAGHLGSWQSINPYVRRVCRQLRRLFGGQE
jgi:hypothetical protein